MAEIQDGHRDDDVARRLVESARQLLDDGGLDQVTVRSVAVGAGMSTMNVYSRFGGKDGLLDVLYREGFERLAAELDAVDAPDLPGYIRGATATYRRFARSNPALYELMFGGEGHGFRPSPESADIARNVLATIATRIGSARAAGEVRLPPGIDEVRCAASLWAMCHGALVFENGSVADSLLDWASVAEVGVEALIERFCRTQVG